MAFRFWRRIRIAKGVTLNLSKRGASLSFGPRGAKYTVGTSGQRATAGIPGTGLFYTKKMGSSSSRKRTTRRSSSSRGSASAQPHRAQGRLDLGFFQRLLVSKSEQAFVDGMKALAQGQQRKAMDRLASSLDVPDAAFVSGFLAIRHRQWSLAEKALQKALPQAHDIGKLLSKYQLSIAPELAITDTIWIQVPLNRQGILLGLVEVWQEMEEYQKAADTLLELRRHLPHDVVVKLSLAELLLTVDPDNQAFCKKVINYSADIQNESAVHAALLYYKAKALITLGMHTAARDTLTMALRRTKDRPDDLLKAVRYERALVYDALGQKARARGDLEKLYAEAPSFEEVAERLGLR